MSASSRFFVVQADRSLDIALDISVLLRLGSRETPLRGWRWNLYHRPRWFLLHQHNLCHHRCVDFLGLYPEEGIGSPRVASSGVEVKRRARKRKGKRLRWSIRTIEQDDHCVVPTIDGVDHADSLNLRRCCPWHRLLPLAFIKPIPARLGAFYVMPDSTESVMLKIRATSLNPSRTTYQAPR